MTPFLLVCREENDLYQILVANGVPCQRIDRAAEAFAKVAVNGSVLILADGYPEVPTAVNDRWLELAKEKNLRLYLEFPASLPCVPVAPIRKADHLERGIVASNHFGEALPFGSIFTVPGAHLLEATAPEPWLVLGIVAGFTRVAFDLETAQTRPLLFTLPGAEVMVATTGLSHFLRGRFAPTGAWQAIFSSILNWLSRGRGDYHLSWQPGVSPSFAKSETLPDDAREKALTRAADWFYRARLFCPPGSEAAYTAETGDSRPIADWPEGDGSEGVLEGLTSAIDHHGRQSVRWWRRADCNGEVSGAMALAGLARGDEKWKQTAAHLADWLYFKSILSQGDRAIPSHPSYGLLGWHDRGAYGIYGDGWDVYYGDDNARALLGTMATAGALGMTRWDRPILRCILANFRTTGPNGFRVSRLASSSLVKEGWSSYFFSDHRSFSPHFQAYPWACYLWAYSKTGDALLLERTVSGLRLMMEAYPDGWHWTNGIQQERARMLLPLAWLVRVEDTPEHRQWLASMAGEVIAHQEDCGAIREEIGTGDGRYGPPASHAAYGKAEAPLLQENGDPVADLLYTTNFAFLGLHEAAAATGEPVYIEAAAKMEAFLLKAQVRSADSHLDGAWFRAFDFEAWEFWGSDSDGDWGAWCVETGWTQAWIISVLAMRKLGTSLWELSKGSSAGACHPEERRQLLGPVLSVSRPAS